MAAISCRACQTWIHTDWKWNLKLGKRQPRGLGMPTPCWKCPKIPDEAPKSPAFAVEPTERSRQIIAHYHRCRAVGRFPADPLVERNAAVIREYEDEWGRLPLWRLLAGLSMFGAPSAE